MHTSFTEMFGVDTPIVCGGMLGVGRAELIAAVANAGALGCLSALTFETPELMQQEIRRCQDLTDRPFGVNLTILPKIDPVPYDEYRDAIIDSGVKIVETTGNNPAPHLPAFKAAGVKVMHKVTTVRHAIKAQEVGVDAVAIDGFECAGHPGEDDIPNMVLLPVAARALTIPLVASGGIATGAGLVAALALGASGVTMGTRFMASDEAPIHDNVKRQIVENNEKDTVLVFREFRNTARVARNSVSERIAQITAQEGARFADVAALASGARGRAEVLGKGDMDGGMWWASMSQGLIHDVKSCAEIVDDVMTEAADVLDRMAGVREGVLNPI